MRFRDQVALTLPALLLRLTLCLIFFWAGLGKIVGEMTVTGADAARLTNLGVQLTPPPGSGPQADPADGPAPDGPGAPGPARPLPEPALPPSDLVTPDNPRTQPATTDPEPANPDPGSDANPTPDGPHESPSISMRLNEPRWIPVQLTRGPYTAADFPGEHRVQRVHSVTLILSKAADPGLDAQSRPIPRTMPAWVGADRWPIYFAWAAAVGEILAACMLLFGVLTRLGALLVVGIMLQAMWLTHFGPVVVGRTQGYLGLIPSATDPWNPGSYQALFFQVCCLVMALAVFLLGSGPIGFDRALFRSTERMERAEEPARKRSTFDRRPTDTP